MDTLSHSPIPVACRSSGKLPRTSRPSGVTSTYPDSTCRSAKSFALNLFADPHPLNPYGSIFYKNGGRGVAESVWQLCWLGEFLVISMIHLHSSGVVARCGLDFLCAGYFQRGLSRHMRVRFNAVVARANSAATFPSPRIRNLRIPRCSFKIPM